MIRLEIERPDDEKFKHWEGRARSKIDDAIKEWQDACASEEKLEAYLSRKDRVGSGFYKVACVKNRLWKAYKGKCAYCERKLRLCNADIEHFRPKLAVRIVKGDGKRRSVMIKLLIDGNFVTVKHPGYFWLAYSWENLLLSCPGCNSRLKMSLFPLRDESRRAKSPGEEVEEDELLIHPGKISEEISLHLRVKKNGKFEVRSERGRACVDILYLDDEDLIAARKKQYHAVKRAASDIAKAKMFEDVSPSYVEESRRCLEQARSGTLEFSAIARLAIEDYRKELRERYYAAVSEVDPRLGSPE